MKIDQTLCSYCQKKKCFYGDLSQAPDFCPSIKHADLLAEAKKIERRTQHGNGA